MNFGPPAWSAPKKSGSSFLAQPTCQTDPFLWAGQDTFNEYGVQIMSPQYYQQPPRPLIVLKEKWYAPPAKP